MTASGFVAELFKLQNPAELKNVTRFFSFEGVESKFIGVRMGDIFKLAKSTADMPLTELEQLLNSDYYEARMGAVCIMDFKARAKKLSDESKKALFDLYISRHDAINNWDMVDRAAPWVVGGYLIDKPRAILYDLAQSKNVWERRTAIVATAYFLREKQTDDTFKIAGILINDPHDLIHKAVGSWIRHAGIQDRGQLLAFLDQYAATMPRVTLRYAIEKLIPQEKQYYLKRKENG